MALTYSLSTPLTQVKGIGETTAAVLQKKNFRTVQDLLLFAPLRCEDRRERKQISQLVPGELITIEASVVSSSQFYKGRRSIQRAVVSDNTGKLTLMWFNTPYVVAALQKGNLYLISGTLNDKKTMVHPTFEATGIDTIHTDRLVPIYSHIQGVKPGSVRRILKTIVDNLDLAEESIGEANKTMPLGEALSQLHFPDSPELLIAARERLALEELICLIRRSQQIKKTWIEREKSYVIPPLKSLPSLPFTLTDAQQRSLQEIQHDLVADSPMNRLLLGDVGSGKTIVAGLVMLSVMQAGHSSCLIAPTRILAQQHADTFAKIFPNITVELVTSATTKKTQRRKVEHVSSDVIKPKNSRSADQQPRIYIGTHSLINQLSDISPALIVYDEQHRFGVAQRSANYHLSHSPHLLTLTATPIPRTLMLTIFSHLSLSVIDQLPAGRLPVKTWVATPAKRTAAYDWIKTQLKSAPPAPHTITNKTSRPLCIIVCPFIDPSDTEGLTHVAAVTSMSETIADIFPPKSGFTTAILHSRMKPPEQAATIDRLYSQQIDILVTTPIVEVGVDLPAADIMIIENAERFGLASLHQLRGRVGRANQQAYCVLFTSSSQTDTRHRLEQFSNIHDGQRLAEIDLERRGAGDIFGSLQHGFDTLRFASWTNLSLITQAKQIAGNSDADSAVPTSPLFSYTAEEDLPLAN